MSPENAKVIADFIAVNLENEYKTTRRVLGALPDDQMSYQPNEKGFAAGALAWHIATADVFFLSAIAKGEFTTPAKRDCPKTVGEIVEFFDQNVPPLLEQIKGISGEHAAKVMTFAVFTLPVVVFMNLANSHSIHHRGQLSAYIRAVGAKVPSIYGPSGDEK